nr:MAG TPA: hypothetical protein [Caudoviricetes sp.]
MELHILAPHGAATALIAMCGNGTVEICCDSQRRGCEMDCEAKAKNRLAPRGHGMLCLQWKGLAVLGVATAKQSKDWQRQSKPKKR